MKRALRWIVATVMVAVPGVVSGTAHADDIRWTPWVGCWDMVRENVSEGRAIPGFTDPVAPVGTPPRGAPRVCVATKGAHAAVLTTTVEGQPALEQTLVTDGSETALRDDSCRGTHRAEWSKNGRHLFANAELTCADQSKRTVSSLSVIAPDGTWLDVRTVRLGSSENTRVSRYRRTPGQTAPPITGARLTLADVKEASAKVSPRVVEAALVETNAGFDLTSRQLIDLADAKVASNVIDLIVALSYPQRFVVERTASRGSGGGFGPDPFGYDPFFYSSFGYPFGLYDPFYNDLLYPAYYYSPFAYSYLGRFDPRYFGYGYFGYGTYGGGQEIGGGGGGTGGSGTPQASGSGRYVNGVGYTRVRPREAEPATTGSGGRLTPASASASGGGSSGGSMSPGGYSSGSSGGSSGGGGGRTAQAR